MMQQKGFAHTASSFEDTVRRIQLSNVKAGLKQFLTLKMLEEVDASEGDYTDADRDAKVSAPRPYDSDVAAGQIRTIPGVRSFKNVLVLSKWEESTWLIVPLSQLDHPITEHEVRLPTDFGHWARVAMGQLAATVTTQTLSESWILDEVTKDDLIYAMAAVHGWMGVEDKLLDLPVYRMRTGLPVYRNDDPRLQHVKDEFDTVKPFYDKDLSLQLKDDEGCDMPEEEELPEPDPELARKGRKHRKERDKDV